MICYPLTVALSVIGGGTGIAADEFADRLRPAWYIERLDVKYSYRNLGISPLFWPLQAFLLVVRYTLIEG
jgi:hypothetical protein